MHTCLIFHFNANKFSGVILHANCLCLSLWSSVNYKVISFWLVWPALIRWFELFNEQLKWKFPTYACCATKTSSFTWEMAIKQVIRFERALSSFTHTWTHFKRLFCIQTFPFCSRNTNIVHKQKIFSAKYW